MTLVKFKDLCIDANDAPAMERFWSRALHLNGEIFDDDGSGVLRGDDVGQTVWINLVPEAPEVKNRVHLDIVAASLGPFAGLQQVSGDGEFVWTTFRDLEGNQFCVFVHDDRAPGLKDVVVDSADPRGIATWWAEIWGGRAVDDDGYW